MLNILSKLKKTKFSSAESVVAKFILTNPNDVIHMSIRSIAEKTYTSPTTVKYCVCKEICIGHHFKTSKS